MAESLEGKAHSITGGCVCGAVRFTATSEPLRITVCHCLWCQQRTGSAFGVEVVFNATDIEIVGDALRHYVHRSDESGRWIEQKFCTECGSNIGLTLEAMPGIQSIAAGVFDDQALLKSDEILVRHVFTRSAQAWSSIPENLERFERHFRQ